MPNPGPISLFLPLVVLLASLATLPYTILSLALTGRTSDILSLSKVRRAWFADFFAWFGPASKPIFTPSVRPLLAQANGVVLDIGPGNGVWAHELAGGDSRSISKVYGVEPNEEFHGKLRQAAKRAGLTDVYEPVACRAQDLEARGVAKGSVDTVVTVHVLCSVGPQAAEVASSLYALLKPGGQWLVYEHVASRNAPSRMCQAAYSVASGALCDGCNLTRDTEEVIRAAGKWDSVSLGPDPREGYFECLPHIVGRLVKPKV